MRASHTLTHTPHSFFLLTDSLFVFFAALHRHGTHRFSLSLSLPLYYYPLFPILLSLFPSRTFVVLPSLPFFVCFLSFFLGTFSLSAHLRSNRFNQVQTKHRRKNQREGKEKGKGEKTKARGGGVEAEGRYSLCLFICSFLSFAMSFLILLLLSQLCNPKQGEEEEKEEKVKSH